MSYFEKEIAHDEMLRRIKYSVWDMHWLWKHDKLIN